MSDKTQEQIYDEELLPKGYKKTIFVFTPAELRKISTLDTMLQKSQIEAQVLQNMIDSYFMGNCVSRTNIKRSQDDKFIYNMPKGEFSVYQPKVLCSSCKVKMASFEYKGQYYCQSCADILKAKEEPKKSKKK